MKGAQRRFKRALKSQSLEVLLTLLLGPNGLNVVDD
jgi:hypothetical protein